MRKNSSPLLVLTASFLYSVGTGAQTANAPTKNCTLPRVTYQGENEPLPPSGKKHGLATFDVLIDERGRVSATKLLQSSGDKNYDHDAESNVRRWRFKPSLCDGKASPAHIAVEISSHIAN